MNSVVLTGRVASDPELTYTTAGKAVGKLRLAVEDTYKDAEGKKKTFFFDVVMFGKTAELVGQYADKGAKLGVTGKLQQREWQSNDGAKRSAVEVVGLDVEFLETKSEAEARRAKQGAAQAPAAPQAAPPRQAPAPEAAPAPQAPLTDDEDPFGDQ